MQFNNNKSSFKRANALSFSDWVLQHQHTITAHLIDLGTVFINDQAEALKTTLGRLILDNRWHYLDKARNKVIGAHWTLLHRACLPCASPILLSATGNFPLNLTAKPLSKAYGYNRSVAVHLPIVPP